MGGAFKNQHSVPEAALPRELLNSILFHQLFSNRAQKNLVSRRQWQEEKASREAEAGEALSRIH